MFFTNKSCGAVSIKNEESDQTYIAFGTKMLFGCFFTLLDSDLESEAEPHNAVIIKVRGKNTIYRKARGGGYTFLCNI